MARWTVKFDGVFQRPKDVRPPRRFDRSIPRTDFVGLRGGMPPKKRAERDEICTTCQKNCGDGYCVHLKSKKHQMAQRVWDWEEVPKVADPFYCVLCDLKTAGKRYFDAHVRDSPDHKFLVDVRTRSTNGKRVRDMSPPRDVPTTAVPTTAMPLHQLSHPTTVPDVHVSSAPRGIPNRDNSCFVSALLQCLASSPNAHELAQKRVPELRMMLEDVDYLPEDMREEEKEIILKQLAICSLLEELNVPKSHSAGVVSPDDVLRHVPTYRRIVGTEYEQHDLIEFAQHILASFPGNTDISVSFRTTWKDQTECHQCHDVSPWVEDHATVPILNFRDDHVAGGIVELCDLWSDQLKPTLMDGVNKVMCINCPTLQIGSKTRRIVGFPKNLLIGIQRAGLNGHKKFVNPVRLPSTFTPLGSQDVYHLRCVAHHRGRTSRSGHYVAQRLYDRGWFECNDHNTTPNVAVSGDVCMVMYTKEAPTWVVERPVVASEDVQPLPPRVSQTKAGLCCNMCSLVFATRHTLDDHVASASHKMEAISWAGIKEAAGKWHCHPCKFSTSLSREMRKHLKNKKHTETLNHSLPSLFQRQEERNNAASALRMGEANRLAHKQIPTIVAFSSIAEQFCRSSVCLTMDAVLPPNASARKSTEAIIRSSTCETVLMPWFVQHWVLYVLRRSDGVLQRFGDVGDADAVVLAACKALFKDTVALIESAQLPQSDDRNLDVMTAMLCLDKCIPFPGAFEIREWMVSALNGKQTRLPLGLFSGEARLSEVVRRDDPLDAMSMGEITKLFGMTNAPMTLLHPIEMDHGLASLYSVAFPQVHHAMFPLLMDSRWHVVLVKGDDVRLYSPSGDLSVKGKEELLSLIRVWFEKSNTAETMLQEDCVAVSPNESGLIAVSILDALLRLRKPLIGSVNDETVSGIRLWLRSCVDSHAHIQLESVKRCVPLGLDIERNPADAERCFYGASVPSFTGDVKDFAVEAITKEDVLKRYHAAMRDDQEIHQCGVCGIRSLGNKKAQASIPLNSALLSALLCVNSADPEIASILKTCLLPEGRRIHADTSCVQNDELLCCGGCKSKLEAKPTEKQPLPEAPRLSYAKFDLGTPPKHLPPLTICEKVLLSRVHVHRTVIKINVRGGAYQASVQFGGHYKGHVISFHQDPVFMRHFMGPDEAAAKVEVMLVGKKIGEHEKKLAFERLTRVFEVRVDVLQQWVRWLSEHNEMYADLRNFVVAPQQLSEFTTLLFRNTVVPQAEAALEGVIAEAMTSSNVSGEEGGVETDILAHVLVTERVPAPDKGCAERVLGALRAKVGTEPVSEYEHMKEILLGGFPWLFVKCRSDLKNLSNDEARALLLRKNSQCACDGPFTFFLYDVKVRREVCRTTASAVKSKRKYLDGLSALLGRSDFDGLLDSAVKNPKSREARLLHAQVLGYVQTCTKNVNFSPGKRRACRGPMYAMYRRFGLPSFWITISPTDNDNVLALRLALNDTNFADFKLPDLGDRARIVEKNPTLSAFMFDLMVKTVCEVVFGLPDTSRSLTSNNEAKDGCFGRARAHFGVVECQKRGCLHFHCCLWSHLSPHVVSRIISDARTNADLGRVMDTIICSRLDAAAELDLKNRNDPSMTKQEKKSAEYRSATHPIPQHVDDAFMKHVMKTAVDTQCHVTHKMGCFGKNTNDFSTCRFAMKAVVHGGEAGTYYVDCARGTDGTILTSDGKPHFIIEQHIPELPLDPAEDVYPFPLEDDRRMAFLLTTDQDPTQALKKGSVVVPFNPVLTACVRCNTCVTFLLSQAAATSVFFYLIKYMTKDTNPLSSVLPLLKQAKKEAKDYPSTAQPKDVVSEICLEGVSKVSRSCLLLGSDSAVTDTAVTDPGLLTKDKIPCPSETSFRPTQHVLLKLCNKIHRSMEVSSQMATALVIGSPSEYASHGMSYLDVHQGVSAVVRRAGRLPVEADDDDVSDDEVEVTAPLGQDQEQRVMITSPAHENYRFRGEDLAFMDWYVYDATVRVVSRAEVSDDSTCHRKAGRQVNSYFEFNPDHPHWATHVQRLKSKHTIPVCIGGNVPTIPSYESHAAEYEGTKKASGSMEKKLSRFASYMVTLFSPWQTNGLPKHSLTWSGLCDLVAESRVNNTGKFFVMNNFAHDLHGSTSNQDIVNRFRKSCADTLKEANIVRQYANEMGFDEDEVQKELEKQLAQDDVNGADEEKLALANEYAAAMTNVYALMVGEGEAPKHKRVMPSPFLCDQHLCSVYRSQYDMMKENEKNHLYGDTGEDPSFQQGSIDDVRRLMAIDTDTMHPFDDTHGGSQINDEPVGFNDFTFKINGKDAVLNGEQSVAVMKVAQMINRETDRRVMFLLGGAGTGKSGVISFLKEKIGGFTIVMAPTGIAATVVDCTTIHAALKIPIFKDDSTSDSSKMKPLADDVIPHFRKNFEGKRLVIIDEISMVSKEQLECIDMRLREITGTDEYMGGLTLLLVGDFYQLRPPGGTPLHSLANPGKRIYDNVFDRAYLFELKEQMRAPDDPILCEILQLMRTDPAKGMEMFLRHAKTLTAEDARNKFGESMVIVSSNMQRYHMNLAAARRFAKVTHETLFAWSPDQNAISVDDSPHLFSLFVRGAPGTINENIAPFTRKCANGSLVVMDAIISKSNERFTENGVTYLTHVPEHVRVHKRKSPEDEFVVKRKEFPRKNNQGYYQVEPAWAFTFHKVQGVTVDGGVVLDLNVPPRAVGNLLSHLELEGIYVAMSRVRRLEDIRLLPWTERGYAHLMKLAKMKKFPALRSAVALTELTYRW